MDTVEKLRCLDSTLRYLASERAEAAHGDDIGKAESVDVQWMTFDGRRQELISRAADKELIAYELARHAS